MLYFKDTGDGWYAASSSEVIPPYCLQVSEAEYLASQPMTPPPTVQEQLAALDTANTLTQRNLRDTIMLMNEAFKTLSSGALDLSVIPGVAKVYAVEAEAAALRGQL